MEMNGSEPLGLICALPEECRLILRWSGWERRSAARPTRLFEHRDFRLRLAVSGMGGQRAKLGLTALLDGFHPEAVLSFGFGGALDSSVGVGDLVWGREVLRWDEKLGAGDVLDLAYPAGLETTGLPSRTQAVLGTLVSVDRLADKARVRERLGTGRSPAVLEMETHALALVLHDKGIPLMGLRAVSDEWDFDPASVVRGWTSDDLEIRPWMVITDVLLHPTRITLLFRLYKRSRVAAASLADRIRSLLNP